MDEVVTADHGHLPYGIVLDRCDIDDVIGVARQFDEVAQPEGSGERPNGPSYDISIGTVL